uniref:Uncharacterized protein n=1 Tax=Anguilla anguilla TaxID=7936 RepID=A0A0E9WTM5_ANGAN
MPGIHNVRLNTLYCGIHVAHFHPCNTLIVYSLLTARHLRIACPSAVILFRF